MCLARRFLALLLLLLHAVVHADSSEFWVPDIDEHLAQLKAEFESEPGVVRRGLQARIELTKETFNPDERIKFALVVTNRTDHDIDLTESRNQSSSLRILVPGGLIGNCQPEKELALLSNHTGHKNMLKAGESMTLPVEIELNMFKSNDWLSDDGTITFYAYYVYKYQLEKDAIGIRSMPVTLHLTCPPSAKVEKKIVGTEWAAQLGDDDYQVREAATQKLTEFGMKAVPVLHAAYKSSFDLEVKVRCQNLLRALLKDERRFVIGMQEIAPPVITITSPPPDFVIHTR